MMIEKREKGCELEKEYAEAGFVLSMFRSASQDATLTPWGEKEFGAEFNKTHWALI